MLTLVSGPTKPASICRAGASAAPGPRGGFELRDYPQHWASPCPLPPKPAQSHAVAGLLRSAIEIKRGKGNHHRRLAMR